MVSAGSSSLRKLTHDICSSVQEYTQSGFNGFRRNSHVFDVDMGECCGVCKDKLEWRGIREAFDDDERVCGAPVHRADCGIINNLGRRLK